MKIPRVPVVVLKLGETFRDTAMVIPEAMVQIRLNKQEVANLVCRPENPEEVCVGFLLHHHVVKSMDEIKSIQVHPRTRVVSINAQIDKEKIDELIREISSNGPMLLRNPPDSGGNTSAGTRVAKNRTSTWNRLLTTTADNNKAFRMLSQMANTFHEACEVKGIFGAYHVAAFAEPSGKITCQSADVGMDITVDRILGKAFLSHQRWQDCMLLISDRLRANTVIKTANLGIRSIMTLSVVTHLALETALDHDIDIIHAKRDGSLTIYSRSAAGTHDAQCVSAKFGSAKLGGAKVGVPKVGESKAGEGANRKSTLQNNTAENNAAENNTARESTASE